MEINLDAPMMVLQETTVAHINRERVGCGNVLVRTFALPDGSQQEGETMLLVPASDEKEIIVGEGSEFEIAGSRWRVLAIRPKSPEQHLGEAVIEQVL